MNEKQTIEKTKNYRKKKKKKKMQASNAQKCKKNDQGV